MSLESDTILLQRFAGVREDSDFGPITARALCVKLGLDTASPAPTIKVAVDAGHGMSNRSPGVYDTGATHGALQEADIALTWARELVLRLHERGVETYETRPGKDASAPVGSRDDRAKANNCTHLISIHVNDFDLPTAHGTETLYRDDILLAYKVHAAAVRGLVLTNRGLKERPDLAVLNFPKSCLIELGFIKNAEDMARVTDPQVMRETCRLIARAVAG